ncbi:PucR family transcriptional regulator [Micromonospora sp. KC207]|uniref:PucR family transcriptional regulator n=1 Tax=Micromonospora sp. KC207 TaxID=2530377 RepID=UPI001043B009|nr:PucR family transcriptional regulator ligand-binding domain-containing protein [Micromonospora sp. KC207]TDC59947.1 PucR family transcriptional regulator [Micromonospora sp. KC207]
MTMLLRDALALPSLRLTLLTGGDGLDRPVSQVFVTDLPDPRRYLCGGEVVLTGLMWRRRPADAENFVRSCAEARVSAIGAGDAALGGVPSDLVEACRRHGVPLFEVPVEVSFREVIDALAPSVWKQRATGLATMLGRQRGVVAAMAAGARLPDLLPAVAADLGVRCWLLSATGRPVAGTALLPASAAGELATAFLTATRLPFTTRAGGILMSVTAIPGFPAHRMASWLLACAPLGPELPAVPAGPEAPAGAPGPEAGVTGASRPSVTGRRAVRADADAPALPGDDVLAELVNMVALERTQADEAERVEQRLADQVGRALAGDGDEADLRARLRACGLMPDRGFVAMTATLTGLRTPPALALAVLREAIRTVGVPAAVTALPGTQDPTVLAVVGDAASGQTAGAASSGFRAALDILAAGLGPGRFSVGISTPGRAAAALPGLVQEATHALRAAAACPGPVALVCSGEMASHLILLAGVPADTQRAFRSRLLDPLTGYDRRHGTELVHTLNAFLSANGAWRRCAESLHVHVNTLRYRIGQIERLTGCDLGRFEDRVDLFLALRLREPAGAKAADRLGAEPVSDGPRGVVGRSGGGAATDRHGG